MKEQFTAPETHIPRDRWGRPMVTPPGGGKQIPYQRVTTFVGVLEDTYNLARWQMRMVALGLVDREDLLLAAAAHRHDKDKLNQVCEDACEAAKAHAAATTGTALHSLVDQHDRGTLDLQKVPAAYRPDIEAYDQATQNLDVVAIEQFGVLDDLKVAGTWDRIYRYQGHNYIGDTKTGSIEYGMGKIAMQLGVYSRCHAYDHKSNQRTPLDVDQDRGIIVHLPAGTGTCQLHWVDVAAGWDTAHRLATAVHAWRKRKGLSEPFTAAPEQAADPLTDRIAAASTVAELTDLWRTSNGAWTSEHTALATAKKNLILGGLAS
jgi:hypothetical protein